VRFWDSSAVIPLLVREPSSSKLTREHHDDPDLVVWWATSVECISALARRERDGMFDPGGLSQALDRLAELELAWAEVEPTNRIRAQAARLLRVHNLRAADALQLAAAMRAAEDQPGTLPLVTLDDRLILAAVREGFPIVGA
jgi:predicted nucleic acid-binding protein